MYRKGKDLVTFTVNDFKCCILLSTCLIPGQLVCVPPYMGAFSLDLITLYYYIFDYRRKQFDAIRSSEILALVWRPSIFPGGLIWLSGYLPTTELQLQTLQTKASLFSECNAATFSFTLQVICISFKNCFS